MHAGQYKRIYNIVFGLITVCTFLYVLEVSKSIIAGRIEDAEYRQGQKNESFRGLPSYDELERQGKIEEAKRNEQAAFHWFAIQKRIRFCKDNLVALSTIATILAYVVTYFAVWFLSCFLLRYVKSAPQKAAG